MLYVEDNLEIHDDIDTSDIQKQLSKYSINDINYTCMKLIEAGFIKGTEYIDGEIVVREMTYNGHIFLDTIRDDGIWKSTKSKVSKLASVSLPILQQVASNIISQKLGI